MEIQVQLSREAINWWKLIKSTMGDAAETMTWTTFQEKFLERYFLVVVKENKELEFMELKQGTMSVTEYLNKFEELARFAPHLVEKLRLCAQKFAWGLILPIRKMVIEDKMMTYKEIVSKAHNHENDKDCKKPKKNTDARHDGNRGCMQWRIADKDWKKLIRI